MKHPRTVPAPAVSVASMPAWASHWRCWHWAPVVAGAAAAGPPADTPQSEAPQEIEVTGEQPGAAPVAGYQGRSCPVAAGNLGSAAAQDGLEVTRGGIGAGRGPGGHSDQPLSQRPRQSLYLGSPVFPVARRSGPGRQGALAGRTAAGLVRARHGPAWADTTPAIIGSSGSNPFLRRCGCIARRSTSRIWHPAIRPRTTVLKLARKSQRADPPVQTEDRPAARPGRATGPDSA